MPNFTFGEHEREFHSHSESTKANKSAIAIAAIYRKKYFKAVREGTLQVIKNETE